VKKFLDNIKKVDFDLVDYKTEEQRDLDAIKIVVKKYSKLFRYLFSKYENANTHSVSYALFIKYIIQLSYIIYTNPPHNLIDISHAETLLKLISFLKEGARSRGQPTLLYEDPDITSLGDKKMIAELNRRITINPHYALPEGYSKIVEKDFTYEYTLPEYYNIKESQSISQLVLDSLCEKLFEFHFIDPIVKYTEIVKVRQTFNKQQLLVKEPIGYMKKIERKNKLEPIDHPCSRKSSRTTAESTENSVDLSSSLKLEVGRYPFDKKPIAQK